MGEGTPASEFLSNHWVYDNVNLVCPFDQLRADEFLTSAKYSTSQSPLQESECPSLRPTVLYEVATAPKAKKTLDLH